MVSPTECFIGQPVNGSPDSNHMSPNSTAINSEATTSAGATSVTAHELQRLLHQNCTVDQNQELVVGAEQSTCLSLGTVHDSAQRRSVTQDVHLVANGLKPIKASANKFSVNKIYESQQMIGYSQSESVIEFTKCLQSADDYPISSDANVVAAGRHSRLYVRDDDRITSIRQNDGFVIVESDLLVIDLDGHQVYQRHNKGHLFILGRANHLLLLDRSSSKHSILIVGTGGLTTHSLSQNPLSNHKSNDTYEDRPIRLIGASFRCRNLNGQQSTKSKCSDTKRCSDDQQMNSESKRQKFGHRAVNGFLEAEPS